MRLRIVAVLSAALLLFVATPAAAESLYLKPLSTARTAGPQKQIPHSFEVTNLEDRAVDVIFELVEEPGGEWIIIVPTMLSLEANGRATATATISTPYDNGYNKGSARFMLRATPVEPGTDDPVGEPELIELGAAVKGWYTPAPSSAVLAVALAGAALVATRRRA